MTYDGYGDYDEYRYMREVETKRLNLLLFNIIHYNQFNILEFLVNKHKSYILSHYKMMATEEFRKHIEEKDILEKDILSYAVSQNAVQVIEIFEREGWLCNLDHLKVAISSHAEQTFDYLLFKFKDSLTEEKRSELALQAKTLGNIDCVQKLLPDQPLYYLSEFAKKLEEKTTITEEDEKQFSLLISNALRYSNINTVDKLCNTFFDHFQGMDVSQTHKRLCALD